MTDQRLGELWGKRGKIKAVLLRSYREEELSAQGKAYRLALWREWDRVNRAIAECKREIREGGNAWEGDV